MPVTAPPPVELGLVQWTAMRLRDDKYELFTPEEYGTFLWMYTPNTNRVTRTARLRDTQIYRYDIGSCGCGTDLWQVRIVSPTTDEEYTVNEASGTIFCVKAQETRDTFQITGAMIDIEGALGEILLAVEASPAKTAVYLQSNGFVVDSRDAAAQVRRLRQEILGVR